MIVRRMINYPRGAPESPINIVRVDRSYTQITALQVHETLKRTVRTLGEEVLGIKSNDVGTHSVRFSFEMLLRLHGTDTTTIYKNQPLEERRANQAYPSKPFQILIFTNRTSHCSSILVRHDHHQTPVYPPPQSIPFIVNSKFPCP